MEWFGLKHPLLVHLPLAVAWLLPLPLLLAQRAGRGIRPWWVACRYLAWVGFLGLLASLPSGLAWAKAQGISGWLAPQGSPLRRHQFLAGLSLLLALPALWALHRKRKDHESLGWSAFFLGALWSVSLTLASLSGLRMTHGHASSAPAKAEPPAPQRALRAEATDPERDRPVRALDFAALRPLQSESVKSRAHGDRWVRTWVSPEAETAFRAGQPLPAGAFVVLSSQEDRWGRPGPETGPLWAYELGKDTKPSFQFYWAAVPEARRGEVEGQARVYWRREAPKLQACAACHAAGPSDPAQRARVFTRRR